MQPVIKAHPNAKIVLLHSSYPYTQEAGYLTAVYRNVYLDFGEIFPFLSADGQHDVVKQVFELCPTNKIMWSSACLIVVPVPGQLTDIWRTQPTGTSGPSRITWGRYRRAKLSTTSVVPCVLLVFTDRELGPVRC